MEPWKLPPAAKVYEALSAVADRRVRFTGETEAEVTSSAGEKVYRVRWNEDMTLVTSDDNASRWQGYLGYPILAVLMARGKLDYLESAASSLAGIPWKAINRRFRNDYGRAVESVLAEIAVKGVDTGAIRREVDRIMALLGQLRLGRMPAAKRPPR